MWSRWLESARGFEKRICHHFSQGSCYIKSILKDSVVLNFPQNSGWFGNCGHCVGGGERPADLLCWIWVTTTPHEHVNQFGILINPYDNMMGSVPMKTNIILQKGRPEISTLHLLASNWFDLCDLWSCLDRTLSWSCSQGVQVPTKLCPRPWLVGHPQSHNCLQSEFAQISSNIKFHLSTWQLFVGEWSFRSTRLERLWVQRSWVLPSFFQTLVILNGCSKESFVPIVLMDSLTSKHSGVLRWLRR